MVKKAVIMALTMAVVLSSAFQAVAGTHQTKSQHAGPYILEIAAVEATKPEAESVLNNEAVSDRGQFDWSMAEGTYATADGKFIMSIRIDVRYPELGDMLSIMVTDTERGLDHAFDGYVDDDGVKFGDEFSMLSILMTADPNGVLKVSDDGEMVFSDYTLIISGEYEKISDDVHEYPFRVKYSYHNIPAEQDEDDSEEPRNVATYILARITGLRDDEFEKYVNEYINEMVSEAAIAFGDEYRDFREEIKDDPEFLKMAERYGYNSDLSVLVTSDDYYAIASSGYEYRGGAHGMPFFWVFNIGVEEKKFLVLGDLFRDEGYREVIEKKLSDMAKTEAYEELLFPGKVEVELYTEEGNFYLSEGNLVIVFHPYDVGPYAAGFIRFKIPLEELADILKPEYLDAEYVPGIGEYLNFEY